MQFWPEKKRLNEVYRGAVGETYEWEEEDGILYHSLGGEDAIADGAVAASAGDPRIGHRSGTPSKSSHPERPGFMCNACEGCRFRAGLLGESVRRKEESHRQSACEASGLVAGSRAK